MKKVLIVCGDSSLSKKLAYSFKNENYKVFFTSRRKKNNNIYYDYENFDEKNLKIQLSKTGKLDSVIFLCGYLDAKSIYNIDKNHIYKNFQSNIFASIFLTRYLIDHMKKNSTMTFISSISSLSGSFDPVYASSKSSILGFIKSMIKTKSTITFNSLSPGVIKNTSMFKKFKKNHIRKHLNETPINKIITINELCKIIIDLQKPHWRFMNGVNLNITGGRSI